jgi:hypothetical protein
MHKLAFIIPACAMFAGGCTSYSLSLPQGYSGPKAVIKDTATVHSGSKVDYFGATKLDGKPIRSSRAESLSANYGRGFHMTPVVLDREIPAGKSVKVYLQGRTEYAAPILALTNTVYQVEGEISFVPTEGRIYEVKGVLSAEVSTVWLEDSTTKEVVDKKLVPSGSAKLGFFQK